MLKKTSQSGKRIFNIDVESLVESEFIDDEKDWELSPNEYFWDEVEKPKSLDQMNIFKRHPKQSGPDKKFKKNEKDVQNFFENIGSDFYNSMTMKRNRLVQFAKSVSSLYGTKVGEMVKNHQEEFDQLKNNLMESVKDEFSKFIEEFDTMKKQELKLTKLLEQQFKMITNLVVIQEKRMEKLSDLHKNVVEKFEKLREKQRNETLELTKSIDGEIFEMQNNFLMNLKHEELQTMRKHFNSFYF